jgi:hypothetical protein
MSNNEHDKTAREMLLPIIELGTDCIGYMRLRALVGAALDAQAKGDENAGKLLDLVAKFSRLIVTMNKRG